MNEWVFNSKNKEWSLLNSPFRITVEPSGVFVLRCGINNLSSHASLADAKKKVPKQNEPEWRWETADDWLYCSSFPANLSLKDAFYAGRERK